MKFRVWFVGALVAFGVAAQAAPTDSQSAADARRIDRQLLIRYPNKAMHDRARKRALDFYTTTIDRAEARLRDVGPDSDEAALQLRTIESAQADRARINGKFDVELARLEELWSGAAPGTLEPHAESVFADRYACRHDLWPNPDEMTDKPPANARQHCPPGIDDGIFLKLRPSR